MDEVFLTKVTEFTEEFLDNLIRDKITESIQLDYKREIGKTIKLAKCVSAFANTIGGILIYGVETDANDIPIRKFPMEESLKLKESIENKIITSISPRINDIMIKIIPAVSDDTKCYVILKILPSIDAPHFVTKDNERRFYKRYNFSSVPMDEYEIEALYNKRLKYNRSKEEELSRITRELSHVEFDGWIRFSCVSFPLTFAKMFEDLSNISEEKIILMENGATAIGGSSDQKYDRDGYFENNERGRIGFNEQGSIMLTRNLLRNQDDKIIPSSTIISNLHSFLRTLSSLYKKKGFFGRFMVQITLSETLETRLPIPNRYNDYSDFCTSNKIQFIVQNSVESISEEQNLKEFIKKIYGKIVGYYSLPPNVGMRTVDNVSNRAWR